MRPCLPQYRHDLGQQRSVRADSESLSCSGALSACESVTDLLSPMGQSRKCRHMCLLLGLAVRERRAQVLPIPDSFSICGSVQCMLAICTCPPIQSRTVLPLTLVSFSSLCLLLGGRQLAPKHRLHIPLRRIGRVPSHRHAARRGSDRYRQLPPLDVQRGHQAFTGGGPRPDADDLRVLAEVRQCGR